MKRKIEELNLIDNFLFGTMVSYPEVGEPFIRILLKTIFNMDFGRLTVVPQKEYSGADTDLHGARLDVYVEAESGSDPIMNDNSLEDICSEESSLEKDDSEKESLGKGKSEKGYSENGSLGSTGLQNVSVFDIEPEKNDKTEYVQALPQRTRFYHAKIDAVSLGSGEGYQHLKQVIVVMIVPFDPFGKDRIIYTIRNMCQEEPRMPYDDGARTIFLYTKGSRGRSSRKLRELLRYIEESTADNAVNPTLQKLHHMVEKVKRDKEVSFDYMKIFEREEMIREEGREEEKLNTERERLRADAAELKADAAEQRADAAERKVRSSTFSAIKNVMKNLGLSAEQAMQALDISEAEKRVYRSQL